MKYTIEELNFAAKVRDLATSLRIAAKPTPSDRESRNSPEFLELLNNWDTENPISVFVPEAMERIQAVADIIKERLKEE